MEWVITFTPDQFTPGEKVPNTHCGGCWVRQPCTEGKWNIKVNK